MTKNLVRESVERYFEALAEEIASGEWVDLPYIGKIQVVQEEEGDMSRRSLRMGRGKYRIVSGETFMDDGKVFRQIIGISRRFL